MHARSSRRTRLGTVALVALLVLAFGGAPACAADPSQATLDAAHAMVVGTGKNKGNDKLVLGFCYPTAKSLSGVEYLSKTVANDGSFTLTYNYDYKDSDGDAAYFQLRYSFSANGKITAARLVPGKHSSFWAPFSTAEIVLGAMKEAVRGDDKLQNDPVWKELLKVDTPAEFMVGITNIKAGK